MKMSPDQIMGIIRAVLTFIGGTLVTQGTITSSMENQIIGGVMALVGVIWSIIAKQPVNGVPHVSNDPVVKLFKH